MKRLFVTLVMVISVTVMGQNAQTTEKPAGNSALGQRKAASSTPSLADTEKWITNTFDENSWAMFCREFDASKPDSEFGEDFYCRYQHYLLDFEGCKVTFITKFSHLSYILTKNPVSDGGDDKDQTTMVVFNLGDIDPKTIQAAEPHGTFGRLDMKTVHSNDANVDVCFTTTDNKDAMILIFPYASSHGAYKLSKLCGSHNFITASPEYAPRFIKALTHAVELCGGKPSAF